MPSDSDKNAFAAGQLLAFLVNELRDLNPEDPAIELQLHRALSDPAEGIAKTIHYLITKYSNQYQDGREALASRIAAAMAQISSLDSSLRRGTGEFLRGYYQNLDVSHV